MLGSIVKLQLSRIQKRIDANHKVRFDYDDAAIKQIIARCTEVESGGRMIDAILTNTVLPTISQEILSPHARRRRRCRGSRSPRRTAISGTNMRTEHARDGIAEARGHGARRTSPWTRTG